MARKFDCIVIGSGLGGLTAAALCARAGLKVLVLERNDNFGGAATVYKHNDLTIEASLHEIDGFDAEDPKLPLIQSLGLDKDVRLDPVFSTRCEEALSASPSGFGKALNPHWLRQRSVFRSIRLHLRNISDASGFFAGASLLAMRRIVAFPARGPCDAK